MNEKIKSIMAAIFFAAVLVPATQAGTVFNLNEPQSRIWLEGSSTLHSFTINATAQDFSLAFANGQDDVAAALAAQHPATMSLAIPICGLKSEHAAMDRNMEKAFKVDDCSQKSPKADEYSDITFIMTGYQAKPGGDGYQIIAQGRLTIAGVEKPETIEADAHVNKDGSVTVDGQEPVMMSAFGVQPPTMMFGRVKVADRILVRFHLNMKSSDTGDKK